MATICTTVLYLARFVTGTPTLTSARNSLKPETRISRLMMITAAHSDHPAMVCCAANIISAAATSSLSAIGSSILPRDVCCSHARAR